MMTPVGLENIREIGLKSKLLLAKIGRDWAIPAIVLLVGAGSFGLGRLSAENGPKAGIQVLHAPIAEVRPMVLGGQVVASRSGSAYYFPWCAGADKIAIQNIVWFKDEAAAKKAGFRPAKNCKGLE